MSVRLLLSIALASTVLAACQQGDGAGNQSAAAGQNASAPAGPASPGGTPVIIGGASMDPARTIIENVSASSEHTMLVGAVKAAGLDKTLAGAGPYTLFAPTNAAFAKLPAGIAEGLMKPEGKGALTGILTYHVVPGVVLADDLRRSIRRGGGKAELATVGGGALTATESGGTLILTDAKGGQARVTEGDAMQSNGVIHVVDSVLMPS